MIKYDLKNEKSKVAQYIHEESKGDPLNFI